MPSESELIAALKECGPSVSYKQFTNESPYSASTVSRVFGSWNEGKKAAGLPINQQAGMGEPPEMFDIPQETWEDYSGRMRSIYRLREKSSKMKLERGCNECGYDDHPASLDWHHTNPEDKESEVSTLIQCAGWDRIKAEIEKCEVLCANCHRVEEDEKYDVE